MKKLKFGLNIRMMRAYRGYNQEIMGNELKISQSTYSRIEASDDPSEVEMINKLAMVLEFRPKDLMSADWYAAAVYGSNGGSKRSVLTISRAGQVGYIVLLLTTWWSISFGFFEGLELKSLDAKLFWAAIIGLGLFFFYYFTVKKVDVTVQDEQFAAEEGEKKNDQNLL